MSELGTLIDQLGYGRYQHTLLFLTAGTELADAFELMLLPFVT